MTDFDGGYSYGAVVFSVRIDSSSFIFGSGRHYVLGGISHDVCWRIFHRFLDIFGVMSKDEPSSSAAVVFGVLEELGKQNHLQIGVSCQ